jgi:hypothetical protein
VGYQVVDCCFSLLSSRLDVTSVVCCGASSIPHFFTFLSLGLIGASDPNRNWMQKTRRAILSDNVSLLLLFCWFVSFFAYRACALS